MRQLIALTPQAQENHRGCRSVEQLLELSPGILKMML
jgi:hypothetical protein